jgi:hypothetical protein
VQELSRRSVEVQLSSGVLHTYAAPGAATEFQAINFHQSAACRVSADKDLSASLPGPAGSQQQHAIAADLGSDPSNRE